MAHVFWRRDPVNTVFRQSILREGSIYNHNLKIFNVCMYTYPTNGRHVGIGRKQFTNWNMNVSMRENKDMCHNLQKPQTLQHEAVDLPRSVQRCLSAGERSDPQEEVRMLELQV